MKVLQRIALLSLAGLLSACSSVNVSHHFDPSVDLMQYETFALLPIPHSRYDSVAQSVLGYDGLGLETAAAILESKGYRIGDEGNVDFFLGVRVEFSTSPPNAVALAEERPSVFAMAWNTPSLGDPVTIYNAPKSGRSFPPRPRDNSPSRRVFLMVEVFDASTHNLIWQGWAKGKSGRAFGGDARSAETVASILKDFPN